MKRRAATLIDHESNIAMQDEQQPRLAYENQASSPLVLSLPTDRPRTRNRSLRANEAIQLPSSLVSLVKLFSDSEANTASTLLAVFMALVHRYSGDAQIVVGIPVELSERNEARPRKGSRSRFQTVSMDLSDDLKFHECADRVRHQWCSLRSRYDSPYNALTETLSPDHLPMNTGPFQVLFSDRRDVDCLTPQSLPVETFAGVRDSEPGTEWHLFVNTRENEIDCVLEYDASLFDVETIRRLLGHYQNLIHGALTNPGELVSRLPIISAAERNQLIEEWSKPKAKASQSSVQLLYHKAFAAQAARTPNAIAIVCSELTLTYRELDIRSNQLANLLRRQGVGPDVFVGICLERSPELIVGLLAILKAGGAFVPLESSYPAGQLSELLAETKPAILITHSKLLAKLPQNGFAMILLDAAQVAIAGESPMSPAVSVTRQNVAMVLFSSGSTGKPKAIPRLQHIYVEGVWKSEPYQLNADDRHVLKTSLDSTLILREVFWPLLTGGRMIIAGPNENKDAVALLKFFVEKEITVVTMVPSLLSPLLADGRLASCTSLRHVACFGEPLTANLEERFCQTLPAVLSNMYGTTEAPAIAFRVRGPAHPRSLGDLGFPYGNWEIYILDAQLQPVPIGTPGELFAGGPGLAVGYLNQSDQATEKFIPHPFSETPGDRLYRTGDRVRWRSDGSLEFMGRLDDQIKIRGYRIEPSQIESVIAQYPGIREVAVTARPNRDGESQLVAFLAFDEQNPNVSELRSFLSQRLPSQMIPSNFIRIELLPRRPNGKLDRRALPTELTHRLSAGQPYVAPRTLIEEKLAYLWREVFDVNQVGVHDDFFELGGHSLIAIRLYDRIAAVTGQTLPVTTLFEFPTIALLARLLREKNWVPEWTFLVPVQSKGSKTPLFIVPPAGGGVLRFASLARYLGDDRPIFGLEPPQCDDRHSPLDRVEEIASSYLHEIREVQPNGPYLLAGICFGGFVAWEIATQLHRQGAKVELVAILDAVAPSFGPTWLPFRYPVKYYWRRFMHLCVSGELLRDLIQRSFNSLNRRWKATKSYITPSQRHRQAILDAHFNAQGPYRASQYSGRVLFIQSEEYSKNGIHSEQWTRLATGDFTHIVVPQSSHLDLLLGTRFTPLLANMLRDHMELSRESQTTEETSRR